MAGCGSTHTRPQHRHHLAPSPSFPSAPKRFYSHSRALWPLRDGRQEPSATPLMRNPYPTAAGAPTLPPRLPLGHSAAPAWRGSPPPRLPQGSELAGLPRIPAKAKGFGVQAPGVPPLPPCIPARVSFASSCSPPPARYIMSHQPSLSLSLQCFQQNSFLASHCRPSASTPPGPARWRGWASSS